VSAFRVHLAFRKLVGDRPAFPPQDSRPGRCVPGGVARV